MLEKMIETPESVFFKYSCSCTADLFNEGLIDENDFRKMQDFADNGIIPEKNDLERVYKNAFERIQKLSEDYGRDKWDVEAIRTYFLEEHNKVIDRGDGFYEKAPHLIRELCKVKVGKIIGIKKINGDLCYEIDYGNNNDVVLGKYFSEGKIGDKISTHWKFAVEKI